jgi:hypothetical protein
MHTATVRADAWRDRCVVSFQSQSRWWVRFDSADGRACWLHPTEGRWVFFPQQVEMPDFPSRDAAYAALEVAPRPPNAGE